MHWEYYVHYEHFRLAAAGVFFIPPPPWKYDMGGQIEKYLLGIWCGIFFFFYTILSNLGSLQNHKEQLERQWPYSYLNELLRAFHHVALVTSPLPAGSYVIYPGTLPLPASFHFLSRDHAWLHGPSWTHDFKVNQTEVISMDQLKEKNQILSSSNLNYEGMTGVNYQWEQKPKGVVGTLIRGPQWWGSSLVDRWERIKQGGGTEKWTGKLPNDFVAHRRGRIMVHGASFCPLHFFPFNFLMFNMKNLKHVQE